MSLYLALDLLIMACPLALSFHGRTGFLRLWPRAGLAAVLTGVPFALWDSFMTRSGAWSFSERYAGSFRFLSLPAGELVFFLAVPFSCLFIHQAVRSYSREKILGAGRLAWLAAAAAFASAAVLMRSRLYTSTVLAAVSLFLLAAVLLSPGLLWSARFWRAVGLSYIPFLVVNGLLTALPVVTYGTEAVLGIRVGTIPAEDFLYCFALLGFTFLAFTLLQKRGKTGTR